MHDIHFDGGTAKNIICMYDIDLRAYKTEQFTEPHTNNELEYMALLAAVKYAIEQYDSLMGVKFYGDSEVIIKHMKEEYKVRAKNLRPLLVQIKELVTNNLGIVD